MQGSIVLDKLELFVPRSTMLATWLYMVRIARNRHNTTQDANISRYVSVLETKLRRVLEVASFIILLIVGISSFVLTLRNIHHARTMQGSFSIEQSRIYVLLCSTMIA